MSGTLVTLTDARFFLGTVALVNSLRLTGNAEPIVVIDGGLEPEQRRLLEPECRLEPVPGRSGEVLPAFLKPAAAGLDVDGPLVLIDSDMIVTDSLRGVLDAAAAGRICVIPDGPPRHQARRFDEWQTALGLPRAPRSQPYINSGFVAFDAGRWRSLVDRWRDGCERVAAERSKLPHAIPMDLADRLPFAYLDQDVLNAILMTEVDRDDIHLIDWQRAGVPEAEDTTRVVSPTSLECRNDGGRTLLLHHLTHPKPWVPEASACLSYAPYDELFARLLSSADLPVRVPESAVPPWMRNGRLPRLRRRVSRSRRRPMRLVGSVLAAL